MSGPQVTYVRDAPDGRQIVVLVGDRTTHHMLLDAQLLHVRLGRAIAEAIADSQPGMQPGGITDRQRRQLFAEMRKHDPNLTRDDRLSLLSRILDREVGSTNDLSADEAQGCIDILMRSRARVLAEQNGGGS